MQNPVYIVDVIGDIVQAITPDLLPIIQANETAALGKTMIQTIDYQKGHFEELITTLSNYDKSPQLRNIKYPLVYLVQDFPEDRGVEVGFYATVTLNIVVAHQTDSTYTIDDRMNKVFKPVLYPIYYALLQGMADSDMVNESSTEKIRHRKWDRAYWGRQSVGGTDKNKLNDYVDAIDITNLSLTIFNC